MKMIVALVVSVIIPLTYSISISQVDIGNYSIPASSNYWNITLTPPVNFPIILLGKESSYAYLSFNESTGSFESDSDYHSLIFPSNADAVLILPPLFSTSQLFISVASFSDISSTMFSLKINDYINPYCASGCSGNGICSGFSCNCFNGFAGDLCNVRTNIISTTEKLQNIGALQWNYYEVPIGSTSAETVTIKIDSGNIYAYTLYGNDLSSIPSPFSFQQDYFGNEELQLAVNMGNNEKYWVLSVFCYNETGCQYYISYTEVVSVYSGTQMLLLAVISALSLVACIGLPILTFYCYKRRRNIQSRQNNSRLSIEEMEKLFPEISCDRNYKENTCSICLDNFSGPEKIRKLKCTHIFHSKCIDGWVVIHASCPMCKTNLSR